MFCGAVALSLVAGIAGPIAAQKPGAAPTDSGPVPFSHDRGPEATARPDSGGFKITPVLAPAYNPEMQFLIAGGVLLSWKVGKNPVRLQRSTLSSTISISSTGAVNISNSLTSFWAGDRLRITADVALKNMPDNYWGVGYDAGLEPNKGDATTAYQRQWIKFSARVVWGLAEHWFVGGTFDLNHTIASDVNPTMEADPYYVRYGADNQNGGLGVAAQYDSRDVATNAWRGKYLGFTGTYYGRKLGGDHEYEVLLLDYRQYHPLGRDGRTLAWQLKARVVAHEAPWPELSMLGTGYDLRAYVEGRFRDRSALTGVTEYRHMLVRSNGQLSRHGVVAWLGAGTLGTDLTHLTGLLPAAGVGYRLQLQPRGNVRCDFGLGNGSYGIYFNFTEAF